MNPIGQVLPFFSPRLVRKFILGILWLRGICPAYSCKRDKSRLNNR